MPSFAPAARRERPRKPQRTGRVLLIGYRPNTDTFNKKFHKLKVRVKKDGFEVRTRSGFFGISKEEANQLKGTSKK